MAGGPGLTMEDPFAEAGYLPIPALSPYLRHDRYERPKEVFKHVAAKLARVTEPGRSYDYADIACANGELLYHLRQRFPAWRFTGYDLTPEFVEAGRAFAGMAGIDLRVQDLYDVEQRFDVVSMVNLMTTMADPEPPLRKLLSLVRDGGLLLVEGCFNPYDVELRAVFMDHSKPEADGRWRRDFNQHSRRSIARILQGHCRAFDFEDIEMGVDLPRDPDAPHANTWTFRDEHGRRIVTNGARVILDKTLLTVHV